MNKPLPLYPGENGLPGAKPCVQCGYCCRVRTCGFGAWDAQRSCCEHLTPDNRCAIYQDILARPVDSWRMAPAFGAGCCSPLFNEDREKIIRKQKYENQSKNTD